MSDSKTVDDGGPAFPQGHLDGPHVDPSGMSLRDWFAGQALAGLMANINISGCNPDDYAQLAYEYSDAMIAARKELPSGEENITGSQSGKRTATTD